jgi:plastocyanin
VLGDERDVERESKPREVVEMSRMHREGEVRVMKGMRVLVMLLILLLPASLLPLPAGQAQAARRTWIVVVGGENKDVSIASNTFHPQEIDIAVGDTVKWVFSPMGPRTVTFLSGRPRPANVLLEAGRAYLNPDVFFRAGGETYDGSAYTNSGAPQEPKFTYSLTFTRAGAYEYVNLFGFPAGRGVVNVRERVFNSPEATERRGRNDLAATLRAGQAAWATWEIERQGQTVVLPMIGEPKAGFSILRFSKEPIVVSPGTTVSWVNRDSVRPHAVTFAGGEPAPAFVIVEPQASGPPRLLMNPRWLNPSAGTVYEGGFATSGMLFPAGAPPHLPKSYTLTFARPGRYEYACPFHDGPLGMKGTVIVR